MHKGSITSLAFLLLSLMSISICDSMFAQSHNSNQTIHLKPAAERAITFRHLTIQDGMVDTSVRDFLEDPDGYIWLASSSGLMRFDGVDFTIFESDPNDPNTLSNNNARALKMDARGMLWIGTDGGGVNVMNLSTYEIKHYRSSENDPATLNSDLVTALTLDSRGQMWVGTRTGINLFDDESDSFRRYSYNPDNVESGSMAFGIVSDIYEDAKGRLWVSRVSSTTSGRGVSVLDLNNSRFTHYFHDPDDNNSIQKGSIQRVFEYKNRIWISSYGGGLSWYDDQNNHFHRVKFSIDGGGSEEITMLDEITIDSRGVLWITTAGQGLLEINLDTMTGTLHKANDLYDFHLCSNSQRAILEDSKGNIWIHETSCGIAIHSPASRQFNNVYPKLVNKTIGNPSAYTTKIISGNRVAFGDREGLFVYDLMAQKLSEIKPASNITMDVGRVRGLYELNSGLLASTGRNGVWLVNLENNQQSFSSTSSFSNDRMLSASDIYQLKNGMVFVSVTSRGVSVFDPSSGSFTNLGYRLSGQDLSPDKISHTLITGMTEDTHGSLWLSTYGGLNRYDLITQKFQYFLNDPGNPNSLPDERIHTLDFDKNDNLWLGTNSGLVKFDLDSETFTQYTTRHGLPRNQVYCVRAHGDYIYYQTYEANARWHIPTETTEIFTISDGFSGYIAGNHESCDVSDDGMVLFGTTNGFTYFYPDELRLPDQSYKIDLQQLKIDDVDIKDVSEPLNLSHNTSLIQASFRALEYYAPQNIRYQIKLENFDSAWRDIGSATTTQYTNLDSGSYAFKVRAYNKRGDMSEATLFSFNKAINPLYSPVAIFLYVLILFAAFASYWLAQRRKVAFLKAFADKEQQLNTELRELQMHLDEVREQERTSLARELHDELAQILVAIKLELSWVGSALQSNKLDDANERLPEINSIVDTCVSTVRKIAKGLRPAVLDDLGLVAAIENYLLEVCERANVRPVFKSNLKHLKLSKKAEINLFRTIQESLTNIFKHAQATRVCIEVNRDSNYLTMTVTDDGVGMTSDDRAKSGHYGLIGMRERLSIFKGELQIRQNNPSGVILVMRVPLDEIACEA